MIASVDTHCGIILEIVDVVRFTTIEHDDVNVNLLRRFLKELEKMIDVSSGCVVVSVKENELGDSFFGGDFFGRTVVVVLEVVDTRKLASYQLKRIGSCQRLDGACVAFLDFSKVVKKLFAYLISLLKIFSSLIRDVRIGQSLSSLPCVLVLHVDCLCLGDHRLTTESLLSQNLSDPVVVSVKLSLGVVHNTIDFVLVRRKTLNDLLG